jgi:uncharacterized protein
MERVTVARPKVEVLVNEYVRSVYNWMAIGLGLTGVIAYYVAHSPAAMRLIFGNSLIFFALMIAELGLVFAIGGMVHRMSAGTATSLFVLYAGLNGVTLSFIFLAYTATSIASTFFICAGTFVGCSVYGWTTKRDLTSWGGFLMMGLIGIIIATVVNIFLKSSAYDTQKIKNMALTQPAGLEGAVVRKGAILGALSLYLDFINLFLMLLRIFGQSRD